jgi:hypothetical protein
MLKAENGATMETDLEETPRGWVARYLIVSKDLGQLKPSGRSLRPRPMPSLARGGGYRSWLRLRDRSLVR